jgi:hypothetical protein
LAKKKKVAKQVVKAEPPKAPPQAPTVRGFAEYLKSNPFKSVEAGFSHNDLDSMVDMYLDASVNTDGPQAIYPDLHRR